MKKILVIEDDLQLQEIYQTKFTSEGFEVISATDGDEGLLKAQNESPDLIILDIMLPGGPDGFVVLDRLKSNEKTKKIPVIVATNVEDQAITAIKSGVVWYFVKAHTPLELVVEKVKDILK